MVPSAWYPVLPSSQLTAGSSTTLAFAGGELALSRNADGALHSQLPADRVVERNGLIFVWHGDEAPEFEVEVLPEIGDRGWTSVKWKAMRPFETTIENVMRDVVDNAHFGPVHKMAEADTRAWQDGHHLITRSQGIVDLRRFGGPPLRGHLRLDGRVHGPGLLTYHSVLTLGVQTQTILLSAAYPIDENTVQMWVGVTIPRRRVPGLQRLILSRYLTALERDYLADAEFWESEQGRMAPTPSDAIEEELYEVFDGWFEAFQPIAA